MLADTFADLGWGPAVRNHVFSLSGRMEMPRLRALSISGAFRAMSGMPFTITNTNVDNDRNGILAEASPAGTYAGSGKDALTVENSGGQGGAIGPAFAQLDMRIGYRIRLGTTRTLDLSADGFNLTNEPNFANPTGDQRQPTFLLPTSLVSGGVPRQMQLSVRVGF